MRVLVRVLRVVAFVALVGLAAMVAGLVTFAREAWKLLSGSG